MIYQSKWCFSLIGASPSDLSPNDLPVQMIFQSKWSQSKQFPSPNDPSPVDPSLNDSGPWVSTDLEHPDHKSTGGRNDLPARVLGHPAEHWREVARETKPGAGKFFLCDCEGGNIFRFPILREFKHSKSCGCLTFSPTCSLPQSPPPWSLPWSLPRWISTSPAGWTANDICCLSFLLFASSIFPEGLAGNIICFLLSP